MEDNDIKIFTKKVNDEKIDEAFLIAEMNSQRSNGNIEKAKNLGEYLATIFTDEKALFLNLEPIIGKINFPKATVLQIKILMFFTAEYCINKSLPNMLTKNTAINALYDNIMDDASDFYEEFSDGAEYSFYYLALKKATDGNVKLGKTFAMLCAKEGSSEYIDFGEKLFDVISKQVFNIIEVFDFIK
ncbi:MAG: hypothetical protein RR914_04220 [Oscillospiraceae bacterium]